MLNKCYLKKATESEFYLKYLRHQKLLFGNFLVGQWPRLHAPNAGGSGSIPGQGTDSTRCKEDQRPCVPQDLTQSNKYIKKKTTLHFSHYLMLVLTS